MNWETSLPNVFTSSLFISIPRSSKISHYHYRPPLVWLNPHCHHPSNPFIAQTATMPSTSFGMSCPLPCISWSQAHFSPPTGGGDGIPLDPYHCFQTLSPFKNSSSLEVLVMQLYHLYNCPQWDIDGILRLIWGWFNERIIYKGVNEVGKAWGIVQ